jgi:hypothetical protein
VHSSSTGRSRARRTTALALLTLVGCKREVTRSHEALSAALRTPYAQLCSVELKENGGCHGMCQTWQAVLSANHYATASQQLTGLSAIADPETDPFISRVRERAQAVGAILGNVCLTNFELLQGKHDSEALPRIATCAEAFGRAGRAIADLNNALSELATQTKQRAGIDLPRHISPCESSQLAY